VTVWGGGRRGDGFGALVGEVGNGMGGGRRGGLEMEEGVRWSEANKFEGGKWHVISIRRTGWVILRVGRRISTHAIIKRQSALCRLFFPLEVRSWIAMCDAFARHALLFLGE